jgi:hypothetical protein
LCCRHESACSNSNSAVSGTFCKFHYKGFLLELNIYMYIFCVFIKHDDDDDDPCLASNISLLNKQGHTKMPLAFPEFLTNGRENRNSCTDSFCRPSLWHVDFMFGTSTFCLARRLYVWNTKQPQTSLTQHFHYTDIQIHSHTELRYSDYFIGPVFVSE